MKRFTKFLLVFGIIFFVLGIAFYGAAYTYNKNTEIPIDSINKNFDINIVKKINLVKNFSDVFIEKGERFSLIAENIKPDDLIYEIKNETLTIKSKNPSSNKIDFLFFHINVPGFNYFNQKKPVIYLYIPEDALFDSIYLEGNVGNINIGTLSCANFKSEGNIGNLTLSELTAEKAELLGGVGNKNISGIINGDCFIDAGVGNTGYKGSIGGNIKIDGGVGNVNITLDSSVEEYVINADRGVGIIKIDDKGIFTGDEDNANLEGNGALRNIYIDGGIGNISFEFTKK